MGLRHNRCDFLLSTLLLLLFFFFFFFSVTKTKAIWSLADALRRECISTVTVKILFGFPSVGENRYEYRKSSVKACGISSNFRKVGDTCTLVSCFVNSFIIWLLLRRRESQLTYNPVLFSWLLLLPLGSGPALVTTVTSGIYHFWILQPKKEFLINWFS